MTARTRLHAIWLASLTAALVVTLSGCSTDSVQIAGTKSTESATATQLVQLDAVADTSDVRNLVALSTHIFTGQVLALAGTEALNTTPETQFDVVTEVSLKGTVPNDVVVNQAGGTIDGVYMSMDGDKPLVVGQWYLFATRILESKKWFTVIPVDGVIAITAEQARDISSAPLARLATAMENNPQARIVPPPPPTSPTLTFPIPTPGDENPPPPSPPQPTP